LVSDLSEIGEPAVVRYGAGSSKIDFRLPCGGGLDILLDPAPDRKACRDTLDQLERREPASLMLPDNAMMTRRAFIPALKLRVFGEGAELAAIRDLADALGLASDAVAKDALSLGRGSGLAPADRWTAVLLLFHDHEWELALLEEAVESPAFYIGAQGGHTAREARADALAAKGVPEQGIARIRSPVGTLPDCRTAPTLALSALSEIVGEYERLRPDA
jgi:xanthine dehydrogenase accessory factor